MRTLFRTTALAAAMAAFSIGAAALPTTIDLDLRPLGQAAADAHRPVEVGHFANMYFKNLWAFRSDMWTGSDPKPGDNSPGTYVANRGRNDFTAKDIIISLEGPGGGAGAGASGKDSFPGQFFQSISFRIFSSADPLEIFWAGADGKELGSTPVTPGSTDLLWSPRQTYNFNPLQEVRQLRLSASGATIGLDSLQITLTEASTGGGGGSVPEPASYALVGLALLGAAAAGRRRQA